MKHWWRDFWAALARGHRFVTRDVWRIGMPGEQIPNGLIIKQVRVAILLVRGVTDEALLLRASALTFATILFLVPFLAFMFAFIQTFNLGDQVYNRLSREMNVRLTQFAALVREDDEPAATDAPAPEAQAPEATAAPIDPAAPPTPTPVASRENNTKLWGDLIETLFPGWRSLHSAVGDDSADPIQIVVKIAEQGATNPRALSIAGVLYVLTTVLGLMRNVEFAFNGIWGIKRPRGVLRTISDYLMITLLLPFVAAGVLGITAALAAKQDTPAIWAFVARGGQLGVICFTFSLIYFVVPNTRVQFRNALLGGIVAGIMWSLLSYSYINLQIGLARYALFFSTFALFPLLLMWIYVSWLVLLFGALLSFAYQNEKTFAMERLAEKASFAYREVLAVRLFLEMARRFRGGEPALEIVQTAEAWNVPTRLLNETLEQLMKAGLVTACATNPVTYQPGRAPGNIQVLHIVQALREHGEDPSLLREEPQYRELYHAIDHAKEDFLTATIDALAERYTPQPAVAGTHAPRGEITPFGISR